MRKALDDLERKEARLRAARLKRVLEKHGRDAYGFHYMPEQAARAYRAAIEREIKRGLTRSA